ncbi:MAG: A/G-specific adenine glycosylase [Pacificimonas sp.]
MSAIEPRTFQTDLLRWYDGHARVLPWRVAPGSNARPDPYRIWMSEIMLQQTVVAAVKTYFEAFTTRWPTVEALAAAKDEDVFAAWAGLGYYARARNLLACAREVTARGGFPETEAELLTLPGIGPYTAAAIAAIAFGESAIVVDGNIERVMARLFEIETPMPAAKPELRAAAATLTPAIRPGDHAQALMDLGATICRPKAAACLACPVQRHCAATGNAPERLPVKRKKAPKPERRGIAYGLFHQGQIMLVTRPPEGLLGGMKALPASEFAEALPDGTPGAPIAANWHMLDQPITHVFTHFRLTLDLAVADISDRAQPEGDWTSFTDLDPDTLPTLFRKALKAMMNQLKGAA